jgi:hypothetical protein
MSKRPAFQFYPADWRNESSLRLCSPGARSLWIDIMCLAHDCEPYGHLTDMGKPMTPEALAKLVGESVSSVKRWLEELRSREVFSVTEEGVIYSRRMVRDEAVREARAAGGQQGAEHGVKGASHGSKGGRPKKVKGGYEGEQTGVSKPPLEPPPSSSSPSSEGSEDKSSDADGAVLSTDPDRATWDLALQVLTQQGNMPDRQARSFFAGLLKEHGLTAKELLPAVGGALSIQTREPRSYLVKAAAGISKRRAESRVPTRQGFV